MSLCKSRVPTKPLVLVGLPASGKSTVGATLAALLGLPFVDLDRAIEEEARAPVPAVFASRGEAAFRALESRLLAREIAAGPRVVAAGGGAVLCSENRLLLAERCLVVWLDLPPDEAAARALAAGPEAGGRPLLAGDAHARMRELDRLRRPLYAAVADIVIDASSASPEALTAAIAQRLHAYLD